MDYGVSVTATPSGWRCGDSHYSYLGEQTDFTRPRLDFLILIYNTGKPPRH